MQSAPHIPLYDFTFGAALGCIGRPIERAALSLFESVRISQSSFGAARSLG
jgi:hypothetical protein